MNGTLCGNSWFTYFLAVIPFKGKVDLMINSLPIVENIGLLGELGTIRQIQGNKSISEYVCYVYIQAIDFISCLPWTGDFYYCRLCDSLEENTALALDFLSFKAGRFEDDPGIYAYYILQQYLKPTLICNAYSSYYFLKGILIAIDTKLGVRRDTHNKRIYFFYKYSFVRNCKKTMGFSN